MIQNKKFPGGALLLAGAAAFAYYKYSKMSEDEKSKLVGDLKDKGQKLYDQYMPEEVKSMFAKKGGTATPGSATTASSHFGEGSDYSS